MNSKPENDKKYRIGFIITLLERKNHDFTVYIISLQIQQSVFPGVFRFTSYVSSKKSSNVIVGNLSTLVHYI